MFEGSMMSTGWGYVGSDKRGFEWEFTPDASDSHYSVDPNTGKPYPFCCCRSGEVFSSEQAAIKDGKKWLKEVGRSGTIAAVKSTPRHFEY